MQGFWIFSTEINAQDVLSRNQDDDVDDLCKTCYLWCHLEYYEYLWFVSDGQTHTNPDKWRGCDWHTSSACLELVTQVSTPNLLSLYYSAHLPVSSHPVFSFNSSPHLHPSHFLIKRALLLLSNRCMCVCVCVYVCAWVSVWPIDIFRTKQAESLCQPMTPSTLLVAVVSSWRVWGRDRVLITGSRSAPLPLASLSNSPSCDHTFGSHN